MPSLKKKPQVALDSEERIAFADAAAFDRWLANNHASCPGVWLQIAKKGSGKKSVSYHEALDVALTWGWIDGLNRPLDAAEWLQRFTPRGPRSPWSKVNRQKAEVLIEAKRMKPLAWPRSSAQKRTAAGRTPTRARARQTFRRTSLRPSRRTKGQRPSTPRSTQPTATPSSTGCTRRRSRRRGRGASTRSWKCSPAAKSFIDPLAARLRRAVRRSVKNQLALVFLAARSGSLSAEEARALEERSIEHPEDESLRAKLLGYYFRHSTNPASSAEEIRERKERTKHVLWFIEHRPTSAVVPTPYLALERDERAALRRAALEATPENLPPLHSGFQGKGRRRMLLRSLRQYQEALRRCETERKLRSLAPAEGVELPGLGFLSLHRNDGYVGRNPRTGEEVEVPARTLPRFSVALPETETRPGDDASAPMKVVATFGSRHRERWIRRPSRTLSRCLRRARSRRPRSPAPCGPPSATPGRNDRSVNLTNGRCRSSSFTRSS